MKKFQSWLAACMLASLFFSTGCLSISGFQTGRTVGENQGEIMVAGNLLVVPDEGISEDFLDDSSTVSMPAFDLAGRYGITDKIDIGIKMNSTFSLAFDGRYQLIGDQTSPVAVSMGLCLGTVSLLSYNLQVPLYFSIHPSDQFTIYANPRYTWQFVPIYEDGNTNMYGGNVGIMIGKDWQVGFDVGMHSYGFQKETDGTRTSMFTAGIGMKFFLGNRYTDLFPSSKK